ncbi:hypothetical protein GCM10011415_02260 [Salipiger pallidus]|uniref:Uncharacterized protein n=1 Tax=Salipiger pallidus TaxID=1775170 RepID=A0A8J3EEQ4_9RHOB|nr:hypothetical protein [Salipiger pallidus]GGG59840.1 hypothetical protein GCM10011415_02260 [Salipiger pallidus]
MTAEQTSTTETKRDRVRRLLIAPLTDWGFRKPGDVREERHKKFLTDLADGLAYLSDEQLVTLRNFLKYRGEGKDKRGWPRMATIVPLAEIVAPRSLEEIPVIASWFGSARGPKAYAEGTLVAEFLYLEKFKRPPHKDGEWRMVRSKAQSLDSDRRVRSDRERRGVASADDLQFLTWINDLEARAMALLPEDFREGTV